MQVAVDFQSQTTESWWAEALVGFVAQRPNHFRDAGCCVLRFGDINFNTNLSLVTEIVEDVYDLFPSLEPRYFFVCGP